jgi:hypothetical protein
MRLFVVIAASSVATAQAADEPAPGRLPAFVLTPPPGFVVEMSAEFQARRAELQRLLQEQAAEFQAQRAELQRLLQEQANLERQLRLRAEERRRRPCVGDCWLPGEGPAGRGRGP